jgi:capsular exopolysaccharide synthesis family protein
VDIIEKHYDQPLSQDMAYVESQTAETSSMTDLIGPVLRRWYIVVITSVFISVVGVPLIWLSQKPLYDTTAAIRVAPIINSILFSDRNSEGVIPMYDNFKNTQAELIKSEQVMQRVADDLADKNLAFFRQSKSLKSELKEKLLGAQETSPIAFIKRLVNSEGLMVQSERNSELIKINMKGGNSGEMAQIVDAFVRAYMGVVVSEETRGGDQNLTILEDEARTLSIKLEKQQQVVREMAQEYGTLTLDEYRQMKLERVATMQTQLTEIQTRKITLQAQVELLQGTRNQTSDLNEMIRLRQEYVNADMMIQTLTTNIAQMEQMLINARQTLAPSNPELKRKAELLDMFKKRMEQRREEVNANFDDMMSKEMSNSDKNRLENTKSELKQAETYEKYLRELLSKEDTETIELGRKQLAINDSERQLKSTQDLYDKVRQRIQELEMERKRPARISVAYYASTLPVESKRMKLTLALLFGSVGCGVMLAFLKAKADHNLYTPVDVTKRIGVRIIGTTTSPGRNKPAMLSQQIMDDYQTICANLGLLNGQGIPKKLVITSSAIREGKTTFSVNLATSLARAGKKVLLIDGDLRKPDIRDILNLPRGSRGLQELLFGKRLEDVVCSVALAGFDVLAADSRNMSDALELLSRPGVSECIDAASQGYDHMIIDSPPVLAFPDALLWARMAEGVILTSFAGQTDENDLRETLDRLSQVNIKVLGIVLNNVHVNCSYNRYGYGYGYGSDGHKRKHNKSTLLMTTHDHHKPFPANEPDRNQE